MRTDPELPTTWHAPESRGAFGGFIGPRNLVDLVRNAAPWLFDGSLERAPRGAADAPGRLSDLADSPTGWWTILLASERLAATAEPTPAERTDYFALCLAAHFASAATYVPTDVDAKIRHATWLEQTDADELARMADLALGLARWDVSITSARIVRTHTGETLSGHDGERLSVLCGGWLALAVAGDTVRAAQFESAIDDELAREARAFDACAAARGRELTTAALSAILTHNAGDVMQTLGSKAGRASGVAAARFRDLARERFERYGGAFGRAAAVYREIMAPEGHRNYPLREVKLLRAHRDLLLPIAPCLDEWGEKLARFDAWNTAQRAQVVAGLVDGCRRVQGQVGYYRALAGFERVFPRGLEAPTLLAALPASVRRELCAPTLRRLVGVRRESFETSLAKRVRTILERG